MISEAPKTSTYTNGDLRMFNGTKDSDLMDYEWDIASGKMTNIAMENDDL